MVYIQATTDIIFTEASINAASNVGGNDAYEYVQIYNASDKVINLKDYKLAYQKKKIASISGVYFNDITFTTPADGIPEPDRIDIYPGQFMAIWIKVNAPQ